MGDKKRYSIGVLIGGVHTYFPKEIIRGILQASSELDVSVYFFLGTQTKGFFQDILGEYQRDTYDYQFNTIHDYTLIGGMDGMIINFGTLGIYLKNHDAYAFARRYNSIPTIFLSEQVDLPNCYSRISDNYQGICEVMEHLISEHGCKKILFMQGPEGNRDAQEREQAYLDTMAKHGFPVDDKMLARGNYSEFVDKEVEQLLDNNPDAQAIVFANDEMAFSGYKVCGRRGIQVGRDILFTGYDDCEISRDMNPPLTTVSQDGAAMGRIAMYDLVELLRGGTIEQTKRIPVSFVQRESCGCVPELPEEEEAQSLSEEVHHLTRTVANMKQELVSYQRKSWFIPMLARDLNDFTEDDTGFCLEIMEKLKDLRIRSAYLYLLDPPITYDGESDWVCPETLRLAAYYRDGQAFSYQFYDRPLITREHPISQHVSDNTAHQFMVFLLFSGDRQYGLLSVDIKQEDFPFFYIVSLQLGLSLRYLEIGKIEAAHRRDMSRDMEVIRERNRVLDIMAGYDELTGLFNLRGFTAQTQKLCQEDIPQKAHMIYADLDHLKEINDVWGHPEGNFALQSVSGILQHCLRGNDILARIGGDEFLALVTSGSESFEDIFRKRVKLACRELNETSGKPFYVEVSIGIVPFVLKGDTDIQKVIAEADKNLYEAKKTRRTSVRRE